MRGRGFGDGGRCHGCRGHPQIFASERAQRPLHPDDPHIPQASRRKLSAQLSGVMPVADALERVPLRVMAAGEYLNQVSLRLAVPESSVCRQGGGPAPSGDAGRHHDAPRGAHPDRLAEGPGPVRPERQVVERAHQEHDVNGSVPQR